jgi:nucleotide-binding universal stress UspA family protein
MYDRVLVPLDGSAFAEEIIPFALAFAQAMHIGTTLLRVTAEARETASAEEYIRELAQRIGAEGKTITAEEDTATTILQELRSQARTLVTMTTHGRTGLLEAVLGSVAQRVVKEAAGPILVYRPRGAPSSISTVPAPISVVLVPLDGSVFSEWIVPHAAEMALALKTEMVMVQVLTDVHPPALASQGDVMEESYIRSRARHATQKWGIQVNWDTLHGDTASAICEYVKSRQNVVVAMSSHGRRGLSRAILGSVAGECVRRAGVPVLVYHAETSSRPSNI